MGTLHVGYLINTYPAGSQTFIRREIRALEGSGVRVHRIALRGWDSHVVDPMDLAEREVTQYILRHPALLLKASIATALRQPLRFVGALREAVRMARCSERGLPYHLAYLAEACRLLALSRELQVDHLHAHFGTNAAEVVMLARMLGGPRYSFTVHGPEEFDRPVALHLREKIERSSFVVAISSFSRSQLFRWLPHGTWPKVEVVHCGIDAEFREAPPLAPQGNRLVCVGRLCEQKGQLLLIEAARQLAERGLVFELVLVGDGELRPELEAAIARNGLGQCVRITGWLSSAEVRKQMESARALVLPSFAEGLPVALMEAMALGRPVLTTAIAGIPELVEHGRHGWLLPAGDPHALAQAMTEALLTPPERLAAMGAAARERVLRRHCVQESARRLAGLFQRVHA